MLMDDPRLPRTINRAVDARDKGDKLFDVGNACADCGVSLAHRPSKTIRCEDCYAVHEKIMMDEWRDHNAEHLADYHEGYKPRKAELAHARHLALRNDPEAWAEHLRKAREYRWNKDKNDEDYDSIRGYDPRCEWCNVSIREKSRLAHYCDVCAKEADNEDASRRRNWAMEWAKAKAGPNQTSFLE